MIDQPYSPLPIELITESAWIFGRLALERSVNIESLRAALNLDEYGLSGRSLLESGRLVDLLNGSAAYIPLNGAWVQPHFPMDVLDRTLDSLAINALEILCAAPPERPLPEEAARAPAPPPDLRLERRSVELQIGPLLVKGELHVAAGADPVAAYFNSTRSYVPLTNAFALYLPEQSRQWRRSVLCVNVRRTQIMVASAGVTRPDLVEVLRSAGAEGRR